MRLGARADRFSILLVTTLALSGGGVEPAVAATLEERLERLEREQERLKEELEEKDARIRELESDRDEQEASAPDEPAAEDVELSPDGGAAETAPADEDVADGETGKAAARRRKLEKAAEIAQQPTWGDMSPGNGFKVASTGLGELSISAYGLVRYLNQLPDNQNFDDSLGARSPGNENRPIVADRPVRPGVRCPGAPRRET